MLEIILLLILSSMIGKKANNAGLAEGTFKKRLWGYWFLGEFAGVIAGFGISAAASIRGDEALLPVIFLGIMGAILGATMAFRSVDKAAKELEDDDDSSEWVYGY